MKTVSVRLLTGVALVSALLITAPRVDSTPVKLRLQGGPDSFGYRYIDSQEQGGPSFQSEWQDITSSGTSLVFSGNCDDSVQSGIQIGFSFPFYGTNYSSANVSTNGNVQFSTSNAVYSNSSLPYASLGPCVCFYWDDLWSCAGQCYYQTIYVNAGGNPPSPNDRWILQYNSWDFCCSDGANMQMQLKLYRSGTIIFNYSNLNGQSGSGATIGIQQGSTPGYVLQVSYNQGILANNRTIRIYNNQPPNDPTGLAQMKSSGGPPESLGFVSGATTYFRGSATDPDVDNQIGIEVEILPSSVPFSGNVVGQLARTPDASLVANGGTAEASYTFTGNPYGEGDYHWRARAIDSAGGASDNWVEFDSASVHFRVDLTPPPIPTPLFPKQDEGAQVTPPAGDVAFQWEAVQDPNSGLPVVYDVEVFDDANLSIVLASTAGTSETTFLASLSIRPQPYYWHLQARDAAGNPSGWSTAIRFYVSVDDGVEHAGGDCASSAPGTGVSSIALLAVALAAALGRRLMR